MSDSLKAMPVYFPEDVKQRLRREAFEREVSMSTVVVEAVRKMLGMTASDGEAKAGTGK